MLSYLFNRATDLRAHYTDAGVLPRLAVVEDEEVLSRWAFSLNLMSGEAFLQALLFAAATLAALGLLVGYRTRSKTLLVWLLCSCSDSHLRKVQEARWKHAIGAEIMATKHRS